WVGDTERNLGQLFDEAQAHQAVIFLDEADSFLCARGQAGASRHDDAVVNVLLTRIERHNGLILLASNRPATLDPALARRLTYTLEFPLPDATQRAQIWRLLLPPQVPTAAPIDFERLGTR